MNTNKFSFFEAITAVLFLLYCALVCAGPVANIGTNVGISRNRAVNFQRNVRSISRKKSKVQHFPYVGSMLVYTGSNLRLCGASLISEKTVITAASCLLTQNATKPVSSREAILSFGGETDDYPSSAFFILKEIYIHPGFSAKTLINDIALLELYVPVPKNIFTPIAIYSGNTTDGMDLVTAGWGAASPGLVTAGSSTLNKVSLSPSSSSICKEGNMNWRDNNDNVVCALAKGGKSLSLGDAGNPLTYVNDGASLLVGVASAIGISGGDAGYAGATFGRRTTTNYFTNVYNYIDWIVNVTGLEESYLLDPSPKPVPNYSAISNMEAHGHTAPITTTPDILQPIRSPLILLVLSLLVLIF
ncbi:Testisin [Zancudomyces culisetae]|uniref:Testisin n=1 Tax=Zancudomyces culisetae TaxID=1213189 RepID=A0A1R1PL28_ZANCU|nr:Testisin [Zancudomyces culisetae]|eukprot:OMH81639.1 Testisin [Zancudomyces culisetae]